MTVAIKSLQKQPLLNPPGRREWNFSDELEKDKGIILNTLRAQKTASQVLYFAPILFALHEMNVAVDVTEDDKRVMAEQVERSRKRSFRLNAAKLNLILKKLGGEVSGADDMATINQSINEDAWKRFPDKVAETVYLRSFFGGGAPTETEQKRMMAALESTQGEDRSRLLYILKEAGVIHEVEDKEVYAIKKMIDEKRIQITADPKPNNVMQLANLHLHLNKIAERKPQNDEETPVLPPLKKI